MMELWRSRFLEPKDSHPTAETGGLARSHTGPSEVDMQSYTRDPQARAPAGLGDLPSLRAEQRATI
jgi:hypothetical protein